MGALRFGVPEKLVLWLRDTFAARVFVETGTNRAGTTVWAADHFDVVVTIEGQPDLHAAAVAAHGHRRHISFLKGDSRDALGPVLAGLTGPAVLWLDAHWCGEGTYGPQAECPVLDELRWVNQAPHDHLILIDDARLFVAPPPPPHNADAWPGLLDVTAALSPPGRPRYAVVFEDVIVAVPVAGRAALVEFVRANAPPAPQPRPGLRRVLGRVLGQR